MARLKFSATIAQVSTGTPSARTMAMLKAAANHRIALNEVEVTFDGVNNTDPKILVELCTFSGDGTASGSAAVADADGIGSETPQTTLREGFSSTDPTAVTILKRARVSPSGSYTWRGEFVVPGGGRIGIRVTNPGTAVNCNVAMRGEE